MTKPATDIGRVKMNDRTELEIRLKVQGFFPSDMKEAFEDLVSESIHTFLKESNYTTNKCFDNVALLTEVLEMEVEEQSASFPGLIRYTHIETNHLAKQMNWLILVHLEEASAPCTISISMETANDN